MDCGVTGICQKLVLLNFIAQRLETSSTTEGNIMFESHKNEGRKKLSLLEEQTHHNLLSYPGRITAFVS